MTTPVDVSWESVAPMILYFDDHYKAACQGVNLLILEPNTARDAAAMLRALRAALTASEARVKQCEARVRELQQTLEQAGDKLARYREQHSGEYNGGVEYMELQRRISAALAKGAP